MSKADREDRIRLGEQRLQEWQMPAAASVQELESALGRDAAADLAIAARLGAVEDAASVETLSALESTSKDKLVRREARRSLYRLEQRGFARKETPEPSRVLAAAASTLEGFLSSIDGRGDRLVWLTKPRPGGLAHLFAVVNDPDGLKELELVETTRKAFRAGREELLTKHEIRMVSVDWHYCDWLIERALRWSAEHGQAGGDYPRLRAQLTKEPAAEEMPAPIFSLVDAEAVREDHKLLVESTQLLDEKEFRTWFPDADVLKPYVDDILSSRDSPILLNEAQQKDRGREQVERALEELFGGDVQASWVRRLQEMAHYLHVTKRPVQAQRALAVALELENSKRGGRDIAFCEQLVGTSIGAILQLQEQHERQRERESLIVTPQQAARESRQKR
jgi:hypothetical protein